MKANAHPIPDAALDGDIAILGRKGGGKTVTAKGLVERLLDLGRRVLVIDPLGVWAGLRTAADGEAPGYPVAIFGGAHADLPLDPAAAEAMADVIARENVPAVIDLSDLSKYAQGKFLRAFLHELRRVNREALTIVLEEADVFAPQNPQGDDSKELHAEIDWIARRGRFRGFRLITVTQRPARLAKDVLTQCATLIAHKLPAPQDREAVKAWVDGNGDRDLAREVFDTLAGLDVGEAWVWAPEQNILGRYHFPMIRTLDTSATPKAGEKRIEPKTLADVDLTPIRKALDAAKSESQKQSVAKPDKNRQADAKAIAEAEQRGYDRAFAMGVRALGEYWSAILKVQSKLKEAVDELEMLQDGLFNGIEGRAGNSPSLLDAPGEDWSRVPLDGPIPPDAKVRRREEITPKPSNDGPKPPIRARKEITLVSGGTMPTSARKLLDVLDVTPIRSFTWTQVAMLAGYSESGGGFRSGKKYLLDTGDVAEEGGRVRATRTSGRNQSLTGDALVEMWAGRLPPAGAAVLRRLWGSASDGGGVSVEALANALDYATTGGGWRSGIKALRDAGIVTATGGRIGFTAEFLEIAEARQ